MQLVDIDEKMWRTCFGRLDHEYSTCLSAEHVDALDFVGITERFDASLALPCKMLNMPAVSCSFSAVVRDTSAFGSVTPKEPMSATTRVALEHSLAPDKLIYTAALQRHEALSEKWLGADTTAAVQAVREAGQGLSVLCAEFQCI
jgi:hypothetical protein